MEETNVISVPTGAINGTLSHAIAPNAAKLAAVTVIASLPVRLPKRGTISEGVCSNISVAKDFTFMDLVGQGNPAARRENRSGSGLDAGGFTMVVLLVVMAIMAVGASALLPTWRQQAIRENEEELIFRGNQYARALVLYARKNNNILPANIDVLYTGKFLRKKYKDPITGEDFGLTGAGQPPGAAGRGSLGSGRASTAGSASGRGGQFIGAIQGFYSTSTDTSIRTYREQTRYIDWPFTVQTAQMMMGLPFGRGPNNGRPGGDQGRPTPPVRGGGPADGRGGPVGGRGLQIPPPGRGAPPPQGRRGGGGL